MPFYLNWIRREQTRQNPFDSEQPSRSYNESLSIFADSLSNTKSKTQTASAMAQGVIASSLTPIQRAVDNGNMDIVKYLNAYFSNEELREHIPQQFDLHYIDDKTGENCALIACKIGSMTFVRYLHEICGADFGIINKRSESALQLALICNKQKNQVKLNFLVKYLISTIKVDVTYNYEETLLVCASKEITKVIEEALAGAGLSE